MAYNLESLIKVLEQILHPDEHHPWTLEPSKKPEIESILEKAKFLQDLFENSLPITHEKIQSLESRIRDAAHDAEDIIESHLADQLLSCKEGERFIISSPDLQKVIGEFDFIRVDIMKTMDELPMKSTTTSSVPTSSNRNDLNPKNIVVGISDSVLQLRDRLTVQHSKFEVIPIVGMGGIGKTTIARTLYNDPLVASHFDIRAWIVISQSYNVREILIALLKCVLEKLTDEITLEDEDQLGLRLYQNLWGRRFLIVLDDMWNCELWNDLKMFFPSERNGSRIVVTTRELSVANYASSESPHHQMNFLNDLESWSLLCRKVFTEESCPEELEEVGKNIAKECMGLPLAIHVVGGLLSQLERTKDIWIQVANDVSSTIINKNENFSNILNLSYIHLPDHLKPCFLYLGVFPEDHEIKATKLIRLWVAEGFLKPILGKSLEEAAKLYLKTLVDRNLLLICRQEIKGNVKTYIMHDLLRDLCIRKAREEKFLNVMSDSVWEFNPDNMRRLSASTLKQLRFIGSSPNSAKVARSVLAILIPSRIFRFRGVDISELQLLRILDILGIENPKFPKQVGKLVNLRYLAFACRLLKLPSSISALCNLQTLIIHLKLPELMPYKPYGMQGLKHIKFKGNYPHCDIQDGEKVALQEDLQTLSYIIVDDSLPKILEASPNLKKLGISQHKDISVSSTIDLACLSKLEMLKCYGLFRDVLEKAPSFLSLLILPLSLRKLTLRECRIPSEFMEGVGSLPSLQILRLQWCAFESETWEPTEGKFCHLRLLVFEGLYLMKWMANEMHYPKLECLVIRDCSLLEEIPCEIGDISTLEIIELHGVCRPSALDSARKIQEEQNDLGNDVLQVYINAYVRRL